MPPQKLSRLIFAIQTSLWVIVLIVLLVILPANGFVGLQDFNNALKAESVPGALALISWTDFFFALTMVGLSYLMFRHLQAHRSLLIAFAICTPLFAISLWFVGHDLMFHLLDWRTIQHDPASTNYAMDRVLWTVRNVVFFAVGFLLMLSTRTHAGIQHRLQAR